jgi:hypothetical protein
MQRVVQSGLLVILCLPLTKAATELFAGDDTGRDSDAWRARHAILARARVFLDDPSGIAARDLTRPQGDPWRFVADRPVECRYVPKRVTGTTPKFDCALPDGEIVKVKYGRTPERHGEVAATRLLGALGFGADRVAFVERLRCHGCPPSPFRLRQVLDQFYASRLVDVIAAGASYRDYEWVTVERKIPGESVEVGDDEGWGWFDLHHVTPAAGGATAADLDALRLIALFIVHWDNKEANQRLTCVDEPKPATPDLPACRSPLIMLQDVGATFGPTKVDFEAWRATPIWQDAAACTASMETMPHDGGTFLPVTITEAGRRTLASRLTRLTERQVHDLFTSARFPDVGQARTSNARPADVTPWVRVFQAKVRDIADRPPCPR